MSKSESLTCYLCGESTPFPSSVVSSYFGLFCCDDCLDLRLPIDFTTCKENGECCVCSETKTVFKLDKCNHEACFDCCKKIYISLKMEHPNSFNELTCECPVWPYKNDEMPIEKFYEFEDKHFNYEKNTYDELIEIRDRIKSERPDWLNAEEIINYENQLFRFYENIVKIEKNKKKNKENYRKIKYNNYCPLCKTESN
jgi:hypothetical protein